MSNQNQKLQDFFLNYVRKEKIPVSIFLTSGNCLKGTIKGFDNFCILLKQTNHQLVYKHAISTISPEKEIDIKFDNIKEQ
jgi:host factor-I protein